MAQLQLELNGLRRTSRQLNAQLAQVDKQLSSDKIALAELAQQNDSANKLIASGQSENQTLQEKLSVETESLNEQRALGINLEAQLRESESKTKEREQVLAADTELLAHDREIRDLIGARDLYVADINDVSGNGKSTKPFGRIFYTKDRSLVFYGYDLDKQSGLAHSVGFQAWGSIDGTHQVSLGMFYQDESHKRWISKFDDAKTLGLLNMVFVTAEPPGGSQKPTGKPLLMAYLQIAPNHL